MENPVRIVRELVGDTQGEFAIRLGKSYSSVQGYEAGKRVPRDVIEKLKSIAVEHDRADVALLLSSDDWQVRRMLNPGETLLSQARSKPISAGNADWHALLDEIFDSGVQDAIRGVQDNLVVLVNYVRVLRGAPPMTLKSATRKR